MEPLILGHGLYDLFLLKILLACTIIVEDTTPKRGRLQHCYCVLEIVRLICAFFVNIIKKK
jgi:hypothetical protein